MLTREQALSGYGFHAEPCKEQHGKRGGYKSDVEYWRVNGKPKLWKTRPDDFSIPIKYGLRNYHYLTPQNMHMFHLPEDCPLEGPRAAPPGVEYPEELKQQSNLTSLPGGFMLKPAIKQKKQEAIRQSKPKSELSQAIDRLEKAVGDDESWKKPQTLDCGHSEAQTSPHTGFYRDRAGKSICTNCATQDEKNNMMETGRGIMYLTNTNPRKHSKQEIEAARLAWAGDRTGAIPDEPEDIANLKNIQSGFHSYAPSTYDQHGNLAMLNPAIQERKNSYYKPLMERHSQMLRENEPKWVVEGVKGHSYPLVGGINTVGHNMAGKVHHFYFVGPDEKLWHGRQYGGGHYLRENGPQSGYYSHVERTNKEKDKYGRWANLRKPRKIKASLDKATDDLNASIEKAWPDIQTARDYKRFKRAFADGTKGLKNFSVGSAFDPDIADDPDYNDDTGDYAGKEQPCPECYQYSDEGHFSRSPCDICRRPWGGDRYPAHSWHETNERLFHHDICPDCYFYHEDGKLPDQQMRSIQREAAKHKSPSGDRARNLHNLVSSSGRGGNPNMLKPAIQEEARKHLGPKMDKANDKQRNAALEAMHALYSGGKTDDEVKHTLDRLVGDRYFTSDERNNLFSQARGERSLLIRPGGNMIKPAIDARNDELNKAVKSLEATINKFGGRGSDAVDAFMNHQPLRQRSREKKSNMWTDGKTIYSYGMPLAHYAPDGSIKFNYHRRDLGGPSVSPTTNGHMSALEGRIPYSQEDKESVMPDPKPGKPYLDRIKGDPLSHAEALHFARSGLLGPYGMHGVTDRKAQVKRRKGYGDDYNTTRDRNHPWANSWQGDNPKAAFLKNTWWPHEDEERPCCRDNFLSGGGWRRWQEHVASPEHIANLVGVDAETLKHHIKNSPVTKYREDMHKQLDDLQANEPYVPWSMQYGRGSHMFKPAMQDMASQRRAVVQSAMNKIKAYVQPKLQLHPESKMKKAILAKADFHRHNGEEGWHPTDREHRDADLHNKIKDHKINTQVMGRDGHSMDEKEYESKKQQHQQQVAIQRFRQKEQVSPEYQEYVDWLEEQPDRGTYEQRLLHRLPPEERRQLSHLTANPEMRRSYGLPVQRPVQG